MRALVPSWRVGDSVAYDNALISAARTLAASDGAADQSSPLARVLHVNGFDRTAVDTLPTITSALPRNAAGVPTSDPQVILDTQILPILFASAQESASPRVVLLGGEPGSGRARAIARLVAERPDGIAAVSPAILRAFLPGIPSAPDAPDPDDVVGGWLGACLRHAREHHLPLLVDAPFPSPEVTLGLLDSFHREGFVPQVAVVAVSRAESLMASTSECLQSNDRGAVEVGVVDRAIQDTREVLAAIDDSERHLQVVVFDRNGDASTNHTSATGASSAVDARDRAAARPMSTLQAVQWLSELRKITAFVQHPTVRSETVAAAVVALHEEALQEVIPKLAVPPGSKVAKLLENRIVGELVPLRGTKTPAPRPQSTGPEAIPTGPTTTGPSR